MTGYRYSTRGWLGKASAGTVLGLGLALAVSGLFVWWSPGGLMDGSGKTQFAMWLVAPIWCGIASLCFFFRSGLRAWVWLGAGNIAAFGLLALTRAIG